MGRILDSKKKGNKVNWSRVATFLNQTSRFDWYVVL